MENSGGKPKPSQQIDSSKRQRPSFFTKIFARPETVKTSQEQNLEESKNSPSSEDGIPLQRILHENLLSMSSDELQKDPDIIKHLDGEEVKYVERVLKFNDYKFKQERILMITPTRIKNLKQKKTLRREIEIKNLTGITINLQNQSEVVIHVENEVDLRFLTQQRKKLIDVLKVLFLLLKNNEENLPIYGVNKSNLSQYEMKTADLKKGTISKEPPIENRLEDEDLLKMNLDEAIFIGYGDDEDEDEDSDLDSQFEIKEESKDEVTLIDITEMSPDILQYRMQNLAFSGANSEANSAQNSCKNSAEGSPNSSGNLLQNYMIENRIMVKKSSRIKKTSFDSQDEEAIIKDFQGKEKADKIYQTKRSSSSKTNSSGDSISLEDFKILKFIANGTFGSVFLAFLPLTEKYYAIKCLLKANLIEKDMIESAKLEKLIMLEVDHPFIVQMHYVFQKNYRVYFVMDYIGGGELFHHLQIIRRFNENQVKFLVAQMVLAIGYLHKELNVIYRDLKPENIILDEHGYLKLTDFGLAKQADFSNTFCGTPEYVSPEMLDGSGHDKTLDWWALGIIVYELLSGIPPYYDKDHTIMFQNIQKGDILWPDQKDHGFSFSKEATDLIKQLLNRDKSKRLGAKKDADEVLAHKFFKGIDIKKVKLRKFKAPYKPKKQDLPIQDIDPQFEKMLLGQDNIPDSVKKLIDQQQEKFKSFGKNIDDNTKK